ncbi:MAG TPA: DsbA family protein [Gemmatimonadaceae bacterium]|nr:DsbA family protein [Gemmatimonadaceae bacterium]
MRRLLLSGLLALTVASSAWAQPSQKPTRDLAAVTAELERIKSDLEIVKGQLAQVLRLLNQQRPAQAARAAPTGPVRANLADAPALGRADAPITIVEFSDYQCPFCQRFFATTLLALKKEYVETGKVRYVFRDYPIDQLHPRARKAAEAAHCAGEQGKYWEMHDVLFRNSKDLAVPRLAEHARALDLDGAKFEECLSSGRHGARVERGITDAAAAGVQGTPGFVIGLTKTGDVIEGTPVRGAQPLETFRQIIDRLLTPPQGGAP